MIVPYKNSVEERMQVFYDSLSEKDRRRYAAIEALKLPHGGKQYICNLLGCDLKTLDRGILEINDEEELKKKE